MTTIACTRDTMACDSRFEVGDVTHPGQKVWVLPGMLAGICGEGRAMSDVLRWVISGMHGAPPETSKGSSSILILNKEGIFEIDETYFMWPIRRGFHAVGSGAGPALAAMICGKDAASAVQIACEVDSHSGGPVKTYRLSDVPTKARKTKG